MRKNKYKRRNRRLNRQFGHKPNKKCVEIAFWYQDESGQYHDVITNCTFKEALELLLAIRNAQRRYNNADS
jgi:hypothetical protein